MPRDGFCEKNHVAIVMPVVVAENVAAAAAGNSFLSCVVRRAAMVLSHCALGKPEIST